METEKGTRSSDADRDSLEFETEPNRVLMKAESNINLLCQKQPTWSHELNPLGMTMAY